MTSTLFRTLGTLLTFLLIVSCGGGGGGGSGSQSNSPLVTFDTTSITLDSRYEDEEASPAKDINIRLNTSNIVDFRVESLSTEYPYWLHMSLAGMGQTWTMTFVASASTPAGAHNVGLRLVGLDANGGVVATQAITVRHEVRARLRAISDSPLAFDYITQMPVTPVSVAISGSGLTWTASTSASHRLSASAGSGPATITVMPNPALPAGNYNDMLIISSNDGQIVTLPLNTVVRAPSFVVTPSNVIFNAINGSPIPSQRVDFSLNNSASALWSATSDASWLGITPTSGSTPAFINLSVDPTQGPLASGSHNANATLTSSGIAAKAIPVLLQLSQPTLTAPASLSLGGSNGRDFSSRTLALSLNTQTTSWPWSLVSAPEWINASLSSGTVNASGTTLNIRPVTSNASVGTNSGTLLFSSTINGDTVTKSVNVTFNLDAHRLIASASGVALSSTPGLSRLTRTLKVTDNFNLQTDWTAISNQPWLTVTSSGTTGASGTLLGLSADATGLASNTLHYATITISSSDPSITSTESVRVALWKGDTTPSSMSKLSESKNQLVADPIRPYVYAHANGTSIDVFNIYTATKIATISSLAAALGNMTVSGDGKWLYVTDTTNAKIVVVDLDTQAKHATWSMQGTANNSTHLAWARNNGVGLLFLSNGTSYLANSGTFIKNTGIGGVITASADGNILFTITEGMSPAPATKYLINYSEAGGGTLDITSFSGPWTGDNGRDVAISHDGNYYYTASGYPYSCTKNDSNSMSHIGLLPEGDAYPDSIETSWDGRLACGSFNWYDAYDLWIYTADGVVQSRHRLAGYARVIKPRQLVFSGDAHFTVALTDDPFLVIIPIGQ